MNPDQLRALFAIPDERRGTFEPVHVGALEDGSRAVLAVLNRNGVRDNREVTGQLALIDETRDRGLMMLSPS